MRRHDYYGFRSQQRRARRQSGFRGSMRLGALFAVLVGINAYVFFFRGGTSIQDILKASAINKQSVGAAVAAGSSGSSGVAQGSERRVQDDSLVLSGSLKGHTGLSTALVANKVDASEVTNLIAALRPVLNMRALRPDQRFEVYLDPATAKVRRFVYHLTPISRVVANRSAGSGRLVAKMVEEKLDTKTVRLGTRVDSSLNEALSELGEGSGLVSQVVELFSWDVNWYSDPREGDEVRVIFEKRFLKGEFYGYGPILAAEYRGKNVRQHVFLHRWENGKEGHYNTQGRSVRRELLRNPLNFRRISSVFNKNRFHPVLHRTKGHYGVDYAADPGTPVWSVADGRISKIGYYGGAGKMVQVDHKNGVSTVYMHLQRFARGMRRGTRVRQRQCVGYVGSTGLASGPHLHYGIKVRGKYVDPLRFNSGAGEMLPRRERNRFLDELPERRAALESIPLR